MSISIKQQHNVNCSPVDELLPCPFCGSKPQIIERKETIEGEECWSYFKIYCENGQCVAIGDCELCYCWIEETTEKRAVKRWNTRLILFLGATEWAEEELGKE